MAICRPICPNRSRAVKANGVRNHNVLICRNQQRTSFEHDCRPPEIRAVRHNPLNARFADDEISSEVVAQRHFVVPVISTARRMCLRFVKNRSRALDGGQVARDVVRERGGAVIERCARRERDFPLGDECHVRSCNRERARFDCECPRARFRERTRNVHGSARERQRLRLCNVRREITRRNRSGNSDCRVRAYAECHGVASVKGFLPVTARPRFFGIFGDSCVFPSTGSSTVPSQRFRHRGVVIVHDAFGGGRQSASNRDGRTVISKVAYAQQGPPQNRAAVDVGDKRVRADLRQIENRSRGNRHGA